MKKIAILAALMTPLMALPVVAEMSVEDQIETRQSAYQFAAWNGKKIKAWAIEGSEEYSEQDIIAAANAIAAVANSGMGTLFSRDSANDRAENTRLKPNFFNELDNVKKIAVSFAQESTELQKIVADGDRTAVAEQFNKVVDTCKSCHDNYRAD
ncbi:MAG: cytochrome c [Halomonas sp.]|uniref:c-type cytochrome n=1 Tax=Halomonas sp. TaxID=1486246 RepID=UPI002ACE7789|nr:cytochrome c [Halomonas sp.]MDZ7852416.1 cytochrome c [Halomonas sp.]